MSCPHPMRGFENKATNAMQKEMTKLVIIMMVLEMQKTDKTDFAGEWMHGIAYQELVLEIHF